MMKHRKAWTRLGALLLTVLTLTLIATSCNTKVVFPATVEMGKKYILSHDIGLTEADQMEFFQFDRNETGKYHYYYFLADSRYNDGEWEDSVQSYTITFRYTADPETRQIFCFFDSIEYDEADTYQDITSGKDTWYAVLNYSEHVLTWEQLGQYSTMRLYVCEDYLDDIPNFRNLPEE